jgi:tRNA nucleotidyltransferase (CCA-adding enzyme)
VLKRITPPKRLPAIVEQSIRKVEAAIMAEQLAAVVRIGGSTAKGTYLKDDHDIDVFVRFSTEYEDKSLSDRLERVLVRAFGKKIERVHGSRDYFHVILGGAGGSASSGVFTFEFIPVLNISSWEEARNVTDMSPLHVDYVSAHIAQRPWLAGEIRLTKQFCKAARVYGAESYIGGFSGHVIDLLNIHYGGFRRLLEAASKWPAKVVIDPESHHANPLEALNDSKLYAPLVIVDPIQQDRNSAAAVTRHAFGKFRNVAAEYLAAPEAAQERYFTIVPLNIKDLRSEHPGKDVEIIVVSLTPLPGKKDVVGAKCFKVYEHCVQQLADHGFPLIESRWEFTPKRASLFFVLRKGLLPADEEIVGPPVHMTIAVAKFKDAHKTTMTHDGRIFALERRKYRDARKLLAALIKGRYVKERVKRASLHQRT